MIEPLGMIGAARVGGPTGVVTDRMAVIAFTIKGMITARPAAPDIAMPIVFEAAAFPCVAGTAAKIMAMAASRRDRRRYAGGQGDEGQDNSATNHRMPLDLNSGLVATAMIGFAVSKQNHPCVTHEAPENAEAFAGLPRGNRVDAALSNQTVEER